MISHGQLTVQYNAKVFGCSWKLDRGVWKGQSLNAELVQLLTCAQPDDLSFLLVQLQMTVGHLQCSWPGVPSHRRGHRLACWGRPVCRQHTCSMWNCILRWSQTVQLCTAGTRWYLVIGLVTQWKVHNMHINIVYTKYALNYISNAYI